MSLRDSDDLDGASSPTIEDEDEDGSRNPSDSSSPAPAPSVAAAPARRWRDVFWLLVFVLHLLLVGSALVLLGLNRFRKADRLNIDRFTNITIGGGAAAAPREAEVVAPPQREQGPSGELTETFWPFYGAAAGVGAAIAGAWLALLGRRAGQMMKVSVHSLTTYLAVISVLCFWGKHFFWGVAFAVGALLQFLYVMSVLDRFPFTMLVLQKAVKMVWGLPDVMRVAYAFILIMLCWMVLWSFGVAGIVALSMHDSGRWWLLVVFSVSLFWTGAVLCNTVHVIVSGMVFLVLIHGGQRATSMPPKPVLKSLQYAVTTSFGSICYGSLFTAAIRTLRWEIRGIRSKIGNNECLLCCVDFLFHLVETLVRFFNKYAYVQIAVNGKSFNRSARDAWELFQSTGIEALIAYDCSGAVLLMGTILGGLLTGTCTGVWAWFKRSDKVLMVGCTAALMGMILVGLAVVVVESAVTSIYICYAEDPTLIQSWDTEFFNQMSEALHQRLQYRSARAREGDPVWAIKQSTISDLLGLSLNFFFILPLMNSVGIHVIEAPVLHPVAEGLFNFVIGWTFLFAPLLFTDRRRDRYKGSLDLLWGCQMFLTNDLLPYIV
ncbi:CTL-like protein DDB_G0274487 isoform X3 [Ananas comosus]|uniref:Choline transporter-like protein n=1 Tax=Ananas comosus TaxID=4615 RepID=A0A6P5GXT1_ANACO|nr:CTL-like protein DDB_G0274487 isoform X3 [Ananas comosus]